jgi:hypothetical protein
MYVIIHMVYLCEKVRYQCINRYYLNFQSFFIFPDRNDELN